MQRLERPPVKLPTLSTGAGATTASTHVDDWATVPKPKLEFPAHWNAADVRGALYAMHGRVCAFCLSLLPRNDRGDVEHFRPKSLYFWLAYSFDNYLLSCSHCNRILKRDHFPLRPGGRRVSYENRDDVDNEQRLFLDPTRDEVDIWLAIETADGFYSWRAASSVAKSSQVHASFVATRDRFELNTDPDLVRARTDAIDEALLHLERGDREAARHCASRFVAHGGAVRRVFALLNDAPLPTVDEEVGWLREDLWQEWQDAKRLVGKRSEIKLDELGWMFAVLWKCPPQGCSMNMEAWLDDAGIKALVAPKYQELQRAP